MKISDKKASRYYINKKVFPLRNTPNENIYGVEGDTGIWNVKYDKLKDRYSCNCKNIRDSYCAHIKAVQLWRKNDEKV